MHYNAPQTMHLSHALINHHERAPVSLPFYPWFVGLFLNLEGVVTVSSSLVYTHSLLVAVGLASLRCWIG